MQFHALWQGSIPWFMDSLTQFYPLRLHAAHLLWGGELPLWNRTVFGGVPFLANPQWALLYPCHWPLLLFPGPRAFTLINIAHIAWFGLGLFAWVRGSSGKVPGALVAGLLGELGGWTFAHLAFGSYLQVASWTPWMLFALERYLRFEERKWIVFAGVAGAMQWLGGAPQLAIYCHGGVFLYALIHLIGGRQQRRTVVAFLLFVPLLGLGLSAPQWMTTNAFVADCERAGRLPLERVMMGAADLQGFLHALVGGTGSPEDAEQILYPGVLCILLACIGLIAGSRRNAQSNRTRAFAAALVVLVAFLMCWRPLVPLLHGFAPMYARFHDPRRILFLAYLFLIYLAGVGFQSLWSTAARARRSTVTISLLALLGMAAVVEPLAFSMRRIDWKMRPAAEVFPADVPAATGVGRGERFFATDFGLQYSYNYTRAKFAESLLPDVGTLYGMEDVQGYDPFIPWRYAAYMRRLNSVPVRTPTLYPSHFGLVRNLDSPWLSRFGRLKVRGPLNYEWPFLPPQWIRPGGEFGLRLSRSCRVTSESLLAYVATTSDKSITSGGRAEFRMMAEETELARFEVKADPAVRESGADFVLWDNVWRPTPGATPVRAAEARLVSRTGAEGEADLIVAKNVGERPFLLYSLGLPRPAVSFQEIQQKGTFVSTWTRSFPEAVVCHRVDMSGPADRAAYEEQMTCLDPGQVQIEIPADAEPVAVPERVLAGWKMEEKRSNSLRVKLPAGHAGGWVVLSEPYAKGWTCQVDGAVAPICSADTLFRAVPVRAGAREVVMHYTAPGLQNGLLVFGLTVILTMLYVLPSRRALRPRNPGADAEAV